MIYRNITDTDAFESLLHRPAWERVFAWLKTVTPATPLGIQQLQGEDIYVNVMTYATLPPEECRFESHRKYIDLQYTIMGSEIIEWARSDELTPDGGYDESMDLQFYRPALTHTRVPMRPGYFGIFFRSDAHRPKVTDGICSDVLKLVVKINRQLLI